MLTVIQRVAQAHVEVEGETVGRIGLGLLVLVGVQVGDLAADAAATASKIATLRVFAGATPFDRTVLDVGGSCLVVSQFTLLGSLRKGRRPSFDRAERPAPAEALYLDVVERLRALGVPCETGRFGAKMAVSLVNDGPATFVLAATGGEIHDPGPFRTTPDA